MTFKFRELRGDFSLTDRTDGRKERWKEGTEGEEE